MSRSVVFALLLSLAGSTPALAGDTLLESAMRAAQTLARVDAPIVAKAAGRTAGGSELAAQPQQPPVGLEASGLTKRSKILIAIGAAAAFVAIAYAIDHRVVDNTPSTLGTRKD
jgi:hypothetical protein